MAGHSIDERGFAAAQCGKAVPFRGILYSLEATPH
jgi:hypothetical protein